MKWHTETRKISDLVPFEHNPRQLTKKQYTDLEKSLKKFDLVEIPAINQDHTIIAGHQRLNILHALGRADEEIDVRVPNRMLSEKEVEEYNIRSNKNTGEWIMDVLANSFDMNDLLDWGFEDAELVGFDNDLDIKNPVFNEESDKKAKITVTFYNKDHDLIIQEIESLQNKYEGLTFFE